MGMMGKMKVIDFGVDGFPSNSLNLESYEVVGKRWEEYVEKKAMAIKTEKRASASSSSSSTLSSLELLADVATQQSKELLLDEKTIVEELINFFARKGREQRVLADKQGFELNDMFIPKKKRSRLGPVSLNMKTLKRKRECTADPNSSESGSQKKKKEEGIHVQNWAKKRECSPGATANKDCNYIENRSSPSPSLRGCSKIAKAYNWSFRVSDVSKLRFVIVKLNSVETNCVPHRREGRRKSTSNRITPLQLIPRRFCDKTPHQRIVQVVKWGQYRCCWSGPRPVNLENLTWYQSQIAGPYLPRDGRGQI